MDRPVSLSIKDFLIRKLAVKLMREEQMIEDVISHQYKSANKALLTNDSVEISGFGKFYFNHKKAQKNLEECDKMLAAIEKRLASCAENKLSVWEYKKKAVQGLKENLTKKLYGTIESNSGGMEE